MIGAGHADDQTIIQQTFKFKKMKMVKQTIRVIIVLMIAVTGVVSCEKKGPYIAPPPNSPVAVNIRPDANLGDVVIDKDGRTLYSFANDVNGQNNCTGPCEAIWPVFYAGDLSAGLLGDRSLDLSDFSVITTSTGKKQTTFKGWPLYYYAPGGSQEAPGRTGGDGIGGIWFAAKPDYTIMLGNEQLIGGDNIHYKSDYTPGDGQTIFFTDARGNTLYTFSKDSASHNTFTKADFSNNSIFGIYDSSEIVMPSVLDKTLFTAIDVFGRRQVTYKGWPLYQFGQDANVRGTTKGVSFGSPGKWPVAVKDVTAAPAR
jgi:predicted lipoprotein with Yx(FWY)xxD motif